MRLELKNLTKRFGSTAALNDVSVSLEPGRIGAVLGVNGAGKSTLLATVAGVVGADQGSIQFDDRLFDRDEIELRRKLLFVPDVPILLRDWTVVRNVAMHADLYQRQVDSAELSALAVELDIADLLDWRVNQLSRGQAWKALLLCVAAVKPDLWLVDEPFASGMDPVGIRVFRRMARQLADSGGIVLFTTQIAELIPTFADEAWVLDRGQLVFAGAAADLMRPSAWSDEGRAALRLLVGEEAA